MSDFPQINLQQHEFGLFSVAVVLLYTANNYNMDTLCIRKLHYIPQENSQELSTINVQLVRVHNNDKINIKTEITNLLQNLQMTNDNAIFTSP